MWPPGATVTLPVYGAYPLASTTTACAPGSTSSRAIGVVPTRRPSSVTCPAAGTEMTVTTPMPCSAGTPPSAAWAIIITIGARASWDGVATFAITTPAPAPVIAPAVAPNTNGHTVLTTQLHAASV